MNSLRLKLFLQVLLMVSLMVLFGVARAEMIGTDQASAQAPDAQQVQAAPGAVDRAAVTKRLEALGVDHETAKRRVDALTDEEVQRLAGRIDTLPAGGNLGTTEWILILLIAILVAIAL